ncbi:MAG: sulfotransferase domain-containing protein [Candidatus Algichlamydia australiensis]|nr:sulfotransferase domain-containing protein [Chlamydiales bacterium]
MKVLFFLLPFTLFAKDYLVTAPRSGTHFMLYSLEYLTKRNWYVGGQKTNWKWFDLGANPANEPLIHTHNFQRGPAVREEGDRMLLIVRNYREAITRHFQNFEKTLKAIEGSYDYFANLYTYEKWPEKDRLLIYYEDLMRDPELELKKVLHFLEADPKYLTRYMEDFNYHRDRLIRYYRRMGGAQSKGEDLQFHTKKMTIEQIEKIELAVQENHPDLFKKYLSQYKYK